MSKNSNSATINMVSTSHDLPASTRQEMIKLLNTQLADTFDLFSQTKQAHWNVKGMQFYHLHELYDELAGCVLGMDGPDHQRAVMLGGSATTARMAAANTRLEEFSAGPIGSQASVEALVQRYAALAETTRERSTRRIRPAMPILLTCLPRSPRPG